jgi:NAD(P)-dependent dehydrogenase (short-subunit alcohol dehydrogenase family)
MTSSQFGTGATAVVIGAQGGIGAAVSACLEAHPAFDAVIRLGRATEPPLDLLDEDSIARAAAHVREMGAAPRLVFDATGALHGEGLTPEKTWRHIDPSAMARAFAVNATGPALLMKHFLPLLPREGRAVFATLSARVGSIGDNRFGGWYAYRASKAALNQIVRTAAVELARRCPEAVCVALHPGTVDTPLTQPFAKTGLTVRAPTEAAARLLDVIERLGPGDTGGFYDYDLRAIPW